MDEVQEMMEALAINESSFYEYVDLKYEFDACQFFDFSVDETDYDVQEAERWFRYAREYPPAPYMIKIKLTDVTSAPAIVHPTSTPKPKADECISACIVTPSDWRMPFLEEKTEVDSGLKYHNLFADDDHIVKAKPKSASKLCKQSRRFMKPTASHLAKQINSVDIQTHSGCEAEDTKRQKLEIGFLRKTSLLEAGSNPRSKTTIPRKPKLMTEERARRRRFRSQSEPEANIYTFKALPLNRKILESPSLPIRKKSILHNVANTHNSVPFYQ
ncbi:unnamed protein product [Lactuca saligna]|uniref:TPX2 central domain-containing protein n=1 Tax=Lactuca saligna TaxID=75948 RepID=A0AA35ZN27_LACSI|nr:unnamed protein product [Lactuca saligna]